MSHLPSFISMHHPTSHKMSSSQSYKCPVTFCSKTYFGSRSRDSLRDHLREFGAKCGTHKACLVSNFSSTELGPLWCRICLKTFSRKSTWKRHEESREFIYEGSLIGTYLLEIADSKKNLRCPLCPRTFNQKRLVKQHVDRGHGEKASIVQVITTQKPSSQEVFRRQTETFKYPLSEPGPAQPLMGANYIGASDSQSGNLYEVASFSNLGYVPESWGFDGAKQSEDCTRPAGLQLVHQPASSEFPTDTAHTCLDPISSVFCKWQAGTDINTLPQISPNTGDKQRTQGLVVPFASATASITNDQSCSSYIPPEAQKFFNPSNPSQNPIRAPETRNSVDSLFCKWEAGIDISPLPQLTVDVDQGEHSQPSLTAPITLVPAANSLNSPNFNAHSKANPSSLVGQAILGDTQGSLPSEAIFCTWEAGAGLKDNSSWNSTG